MCAFLKWKLNVLKQTLLWMYIFQYILSYKRPVSKILI